jgi:hypothetical protein
LQLKRIGTVEFSQLAAHALATLGASAGGTNPSTPDCRTICLGFSFALLWAVALITACLANAPQVLAKPQRCIHAGFYYLFWVWLF